VALAAASDAAPGLRGTLAYMAPEQARGERPDGRADLFALGVVLAEALRGRRVRANADDAAALAAARAGEPITVEGPLAAVIARATQTAPEARFADADAMLLALEQEAAALGRVGGGAARELAARLAEWVAPDGEDAGSAGTTAAAATAATMGEETYFRDRESASFIDEVLEEPGEAAPRSRARRWIAAGLVAASAVGLLIVGRAVQSARRQGHVEPAPSPAPKVSSSPISPLALPPPTAPTQASPTATPPTPTAAKSAPSHHAPTRKPAAAGTLIVQCTPWCIPSIDGEVRGADGRNHHLSLAAGTHRVSARRLDDHQERTVEIRPAEAQTIVFTFD
jgi:serine/threonine protein kinase